MFYTYILRSKKDNRFYTGSADNLRRRLEEHNTGKVFSTKYRLPFELSYYEACTNEQDARAREKYLKSGMGKRYLKNRLKRYLDKCAPAPLEPRLVSNGVKFDENDYFEFFPLHGPLKVHHTIEETRPKTKLLTGHVLHKPRKGRRRRKVYTMEGVYKINQEDKKISSLHPINKTNYAIH